MKKRFKLVDFDDIMKEIVKVCKRVEPDCEIVL